MVMERYRRVLEMIVDRLEHMPIVWAFTGSLGMALQGVPVQVHDIDIQTDGDGAHAIGRCFDEYVVEPVRLLESPRIRSHFGVLEIEGIRVEIMGDIQKRLDNGSWEEPIRVERHRLWVEVGTMRVPVLSLEHEYRAYRRLGRVEKAKILRNWLQRTQGTGRNPQ